MRSEATREGEISVGGQVLYMALELSERTWKVLFASPAGRRRERSVAARDVAALLGEIAAAKRRLGLSAQARVVSCYEAGRVDAEHRFAMTGSGSTGRCGPTASTTWWWTPPPSRWRGGPRRTAWTWSS